MPRLLPVLVAPAVAAALLLAGCSGDDGGDGGTDNTAGLGPREILDASAEALAGAGPYRIELQGTVEAGEALAPSELLSGPLEVEGEGSVVPGTGFELDAGIDAGLPLDATIVRTPEGLFISFFTNDLKVPATEEQLAALDPGGLATSLPDLIDDPQVTGQEEVDGVGAVRIEGTIDQAQARAGIEGALSALGGDADQALSTLQGGTVSVLIGTSDLLPRRIDITLGTPGTPPSADLEVGLSDFGADLEVVAPADATPLDATDLGGLLGG